MAGRLSAVFLAAAAAAVAVCWPSPMYREDPAGYAEDILGIEPWSRQVEILEAIKEPGARVAVASGHKIAKTNTGGIAALWFYSSFDDARVVMTCVTARQVDEVLYREVRKLHDRSGLCVACAKQSEKLVAAGEPPLEKPCEHSALIDGEPRELARSGLKAAKPGDFREVVGFTAKEAEAVAGISGKNLLYIVDEASGVPDEIFEAIEGNRAGGARVLLLSNPTRCEGEFFEAFESKSKFYKTIRVSSEESPNVVAGREVIPGLATKAWIDEKKEEWGVDSPLYKVRVLGQHAKNEKGKILSLHLLEEAERRWDETPGEGRLFVGLDPAGDGTDGDETVFAMRRGRKLLALFAHRGLNEDAIKNELIGYLKEARIGREQAPVVVVDREGPIGSRLFGLLRAHVDGKPGDFELVGVRSSEWAKREPHAYERVRDELWANLRAWLRPVAQGGSEGAILSDVKLAKELHAPSWLELVNKKQKATDKRELKKALGRSPDRADALCLAVWEPASLASREEDHAAAAAAPEDPLPYRQGPSPYNSPMYGRRR